MVDDNGEDKCEMGEERVEWLECPDPCECFSSVEYFRLRRGRMKCVGLVPSAVGEIG